MSVQGIDSFISLFSNPTYTCLFEVEIHGRPAARNAQGRDLGFGNSSLFQARSVNLPGKTLDTESTGMSRYPVKDLPVGYKVEDVTIEFILTEGYKERDLFEKWMDTIVHPGPLRETATVGGRSFPNNYMVEYKETYSSEVIIKQLDAHHLPIYEIALHEAFPKSISNVDLNAENVELAKLTVTFGYSDYDARRIVQ